MSRDLTDEKEPAIDRSGKGTFQPERTTNAKTQTWEETWHSQGAERPRWLRHSEERHSFRQLGKSLLGLWGLNKN